MIAEWRSHPIYQRCNAAYERLSESAWLVRFRYGLYAKASAVEIEARTELYVVWDEASDAFKFGVGLNPSERIANLQIGNPRPLMLVTSCPGTRGLEHSFHHSLEPWLIRGEWFAGSDETLAATSLVMSGEDMVRDMTSAGLADWVAPAQSIQMFAWDFFEAEHLLKQQDNRTSTRSGHVSREEVT